MGVAAAVVAEVAGTEDAVAAAAAVVEEVAGAGGARVATRAAHDMAPFGLGTSAGFSAGLLGLELSPALADAADVSSGIWACVEDSAAATASSGAGLEVCSVVDGDLVTSLLAGGCCIVAPAAIASAAASLGFVGQRVEAAFALGSCSDWEGEISDRSFSTDGKKPAWLLPLSEEAGAERGSGLGGASPSLNISLWMLKEIEPDATFVRRKKVWLKSCPGSLWCNCNRDPERRTSNPSSPQRCVLTDDIRASLPASPSEAPFSEISELPASCSTSPGAHTCSNRELCA